MARMIRGVAPLRNYYRTATGPRTIPFIDPKGPRLPRDIDFGLVHVNSRDKDSVIFTPHCRFWNEFEIDDPDAMWREDPEAFLCFKTSFAYELIGQEHPRIVPVLGQDAWTGLPILQKPSYGSLRNFFEEYHSKFYAVKAGVASPDDRIKPEFLPLVYQWSLQLLSALVLLHSRDIAYGDIILDCCWLSAETIDISLAGFIGSEFRDPATGWFCHGHFFSGIDFSPRSLPPSRMVEDPTLATDMFMFGRLMYCIMTSHYPGEGLGHGPWETERLMREEDWMPDLEDEFMGRIIHKCWRFDYDTIKDLQSEVQAFIQSHGWSFKGDELEGLDMDHVKTLLQGSLTANQQ